MTNSAGFARTRSWGQWGLAFIPPLIWLSWCAAAAAMTPTLPPCPTSRELRVEPIPRHTDGLTLEVVVHASGNNRVWIRIPESGLFFAEGDFSAEPARIEVRLLPNTEHHLQVSALFSTSSGQWCREAGDILDTTTDADGMPLTIVHGTPTSPEVTVEPEGLYLPCGDQSFDITITSSGPPGDELVIGGLSFHHAYSGGEYGTDFRWNLDDFTFPLTLPSGSSLTIPIRYASPPGTHPSRLVLEVFSNAVNELPYLAYHGRSCEMMPPTRTPTPTFPLGSPVLHVGSVEAAQGAGATVVVTLDTDGSAIAATQNDFAFDGVNTPIRLTATGEPDCTVDPSIGKEGFFAFHPIGCFASGCTRVRALVLSLTNTATIPDGPLYSCRIQIPGRASVGSYPLQLLEAYASNPRGEAVSLGTVDGRLAVTSRAAPAPPTPTVASVSGNRSDVADSDFDGSSVGAGGGGCAIGAERGRNGGSLAWAALAVLLCLWRRLWPLSPARAGRA